MNENLIDVAIPTATVKEVNDALDAIASKLEPFLLKKVAKETLDTMQKLGEKGEPFTKKAIETAEMAPAFIPGYLKLSEAKVDMEIYLQLKAMCSKMRTLLNHMEANSALAGAEALDFANDFYANIRFLSKNSDPKAKEYFDNLNGFYAERGRRNRKSHTT